MTATDPEAAAVSGELVTPEATVIPSAATQNATADRARGRTGIQVSTPFAILTIGTWILRLADVDLDPGPGVDLPAEVAGAWVAVIALVLAFRMNPKD